jgi:choline dehydrogenase-like flavoprotein
MARVMPHVDVVIVGMGWTGSIAARELADTGLRIVGLERGRFRDRFQRPQCTGRDQMEFPGRNVSGSFARNADVSQ